MTARHLQRLTGLEIEVSRLAPGRWVATGTLLKTLGALVTGEGTTKEKALLRLRQENLNYLLYCLVRKQGDRCALCGKKGGGFEFDHIVSRARGGLDVIQNGRAVHPDCHRSRHGVPEWRTTV